MIFSTSKEFMLLVPYTNHSKYQYFYNNVFTTDEIITQTQLNKIRLI